MTGSFSNYLENKLLDHSLGKASYSMPTAYIALCTSAPTDASTGSSIVEPSTSGTAYARVATSGTDWVNSSGGIISNATVLSFAAATGAGWGTITHFALCDNGTVGAGNMLIWGEVSPTIPVPTGSIVSFAIGNLQITLDSDISFFHLCRCITLKDVHYL